ncbi:MAG: hypothetical protein EOP05_03035 [Proteobacteria bacterium]|nr:MAG: hypothetical protein EOP05_03035 [Pseudomonadota bacterium]
MNQQEDWRKILLFPLLVVALLLNQIWSRASVLDRWLLLSLFLSSSLLLALYCWLYKSTSGLQRKRRLERIASIPLEILSSDDGVLMGEELELSEKIYLPDAIRKRHVHVIGATGSGKTESVILNFLRQDVKRGFGSVILDAKGDASFLEDLRNHVPVEKLLVFDLGDANSIPYNPIETGSPLEAAQRLFASLTWSEEYYKSKALSALQRLFQLHFETRDRNPTLAELAAYLETPDKYSACVNTDDFPKALALEEFRELSGLRDQIRSLTLGHLLKLLSPLAETRIRLEDAQLGTVIYFRLQSLMSPQLVTVLGRLVVNHLSYLAGSAHRTGAKGSKRMTPVYLDEFASFACTEFADLISKARSANLALHFSHQSIGDLMEVSEGFLSRITDNAATKIVLRINDPESAEFFARSFGTRQFQKSTQRVTNAKDMEKAEIVGEGTIRDARQFRASPDLLKTLPTGVGAVLVAHGKDTPEGASSVFKIRFPPLNPIG